MKIVIRWRPVALLGLILLGLVLRLYGLNWDQGNSFHPDERQILFHVTALAWPTNWAQFLNADKSPLNPHFFAYGSFPLYLLALLGHAFGFISDPFGKLTLLGRVLSALFDSGTILLTGLLALRLTRDSSPGRPRAWNVALLAATLVVFTPLQLQLSHFYAVDTILLFFVMLTILACVALVDTEKPLLWACVAGVGYGLAVGTKFSAAPLAVPLLVALLLRWYRQRDLFSACFLLLFASCVTAVVFLFSNPYALLDRVNFIQQLAEQGALARGALDLPYVRQFAGTTPYLYEVQNIVLWGMGVALGCAALVALLCFCLLALQRKAGSWLVVLSWVVIYSLISGDFYVKFMRYMLPIYPLLTLMAAAFLVQVPSAWRIRAAATNVLQVSVSFLRFLPLVLVLGGTIFQGLALLNVYSQPNTRIEASRWMYSHLPAGSIITYEQWDDPLPYPVDGQSSSLFTQATYKNAAGDVTTGLDLYGDDTTQKAEQLATLLPTIEAITMPTDRLDKSIPRLLARYPLTIHYYQLLFSGQLGFHLAAQFTNHPHLFGIALDDSTADESYSVFDHPTARIFVRDNPYPYSTKQLLAKLLDGVLLPSPGTDFSKVQRSLLLSPQQIDEYQQMPPFGTQFAANSFSNTLPVLSWWLAITLVGLLVFPLVSVPLRALSGRGYIFSKMLGVLGLAYLSWLLASLHMLTFSHTTLVLVVVLFALCSGVAAFWQRRDLLAYLRLRWHILLGWEALFSLAFLLFVAIRAFNPDLWNVYIGGEKPMELAFFNAILRSPYMPPLDPWFSGGYINYYYYGYIVFAALTRLTAIIPTTAFNLALPTLFALTFTGAVTIVYSVARSFPLALLGGYFAALIGNFDGFSQLKLQLLSLLAHISPPDFNYWQSSRVIPYTINEFPFWSFLFADLHPHVMNMPVVMCMLGLLAAFLLSSDDEKSRAPTTPNARLERGSLPDRKDVRAVLSMRQVASATWPIHGPVRRGLIHDARLSPHHPMPSSLERGSLYLCAAFVFGTLSCINPWDMPVYALLLTLVLLLERFQQVRHEALPVLARALAVRLALVAGLCALGYLCYAPFYISYQQLYVNGLGLVKQGSGTGAYMTIFGLWLFLALSFFGLELYRWGADFWRQWHSSSSLLNASSPLEAAVVMDDVDPTPGHVLPGKSLSPAWRVAAYIAVFLFIFLLLLLSNLKVFLFTLLFLGVFLFVQFIRSAGSWRRQETDGDELPAAPLTVRSLSASAIYTYLLLLVGLAILLGIEVVYIRDFMDGGENERMNTVFKFSLQAWFCLAIGGALAVQYLYRTLRGPVRSAWTILLISFVIACSIFLPEGTIARIHDHQLWADTQQPAVSANYTPTLDGFAFVRSWYPGDAGAISWLNAHVAGSPVVLEASEKVSYQWFSRVSVFTGLPDVLGWPDHVWEQHYSYQLKNRLTDVATMYATTDTTEALALLRSYRVRYVYVGALEQQSYPTAGLQKFDQMAGQSLRVVYSAGGVTIYEVL